jgi:ATP-dependent DNA helicase RecQ
MINLGYLNIAYNENYTLKLNERSWDILKNGKNVSLAKYVPRKRYEETQDEMPQDKPKHEIIQDELFERLKGLCKKIADREGSLPHDIFSDTALWEMARYKPIRENEIMQITGVNPEKARKHGYELTEAILAFIREKKGQQNPQRNFQNNVQAKPQQNTYKSYNNQPTYHKPFQNIANLTQDADNHKVSFQLYQSGLHLQQIADRRGIKIDTVIMHLIKQYQEEKAEIDFWQFISRNEYEIIMDAVNIVQLKKGDSLKPLYDELNGEFEYYKLRIALLLWEQEEGSRVKVGNY